MKNFTKISILIFFTASMMACKKDNTVVTPVEVCKVSKLSYVDSKQVTTSSTTYEYNSDGKVSKATDSRTGNYYTISYSSTAIVIIQFDKNNKQGTSNSYILNSAGYIVKGDYYGVVQTYEYDSQGYLMKLSYLSSGGGTFTTNYTYTDGNLTNIKSYDPLGKLYYSASFDYYLDKTNTLGDDNSGSTVVFIPNQNLFGKGSKNLVKKLTLIINSTPAQTTITDYTYTFDTKGNITRVVDSSSGRETYATDLEYICK
jgi:Domain of unknown function (DUF4595) with porin-like fold